MQAGYRYLCAMLLAALCAGAAVSVPAAGRDAGWRPVPSLPGLSGLAWIGDDLFLAVHDGKNPRDNREPRVSRIRLPGKERGLLRQPYPRIDWPAPDGIPSDLESIARIPGSDTYLVLESGAGGQGMHPFRRLIRLELSESGPQVTGSTLLPRSIANVEGSAVVHTRAGQFFVFAERGEDEPATVVYWGELQQDPLRVVRIRRATFQAPGPAGSNMRHVSALESDGRGRLYAVSTIDPGDFGPFRSVLWQIGEFQPGADGRPGLCLYPAPRQLATMDGLKIESLAIRESREGTPEFFAGTDDESYGGIIRPVPVRLPD